MPNKSNKSLKTHTNPKQERAKATAENILNGARNILEKHGRKGLSARKLASQCDMTTGAIYGHFASMSAILYRLYEDRLNQEFEMYEGIFNENNESLSWAALVDKIVDHDANLEWGSKLDLALEEAVLNDENLEQITIQRNIKLKNLLISELQKRVPKVDIGRLEILADIAMTLNTRAYQLRKIEGCEDPDFALKVTLELVKSLIDFTK